jgi:hypothetical protein
MSSIALGHDRSRERSVPPRGSVRILFLLNSCLQHLTLRMIGGMHHDNFPSYVQILQNVPNCQKLTQTLETNNTP